ncbi:hypothetical protein [Massiliimalia massiliensis]|uniref:hypothetical protein n=1 Tax=Massiliimalia massiliensis TaxID=1852384 RepID=UPI000986036C|nr:hypothetical protein [Massiliimalia massiliensis]
MDQIVYIPTNYTDAGKILGMFEIRNTIECVVLCVPLALLIFFLSPLGITATIVIITVLVVPLGGFTLFGIQEHSFFSFLYIYTKWYKNRRILTYRGSKWINEKRKPGKN